MFFSQLASSSAVSKGSLAPSNKHPALIRRFPHPNANICSKTGEVPSFLPICSKRKSLPEPKLVLSWLVLTWGRKQLQYTAHLFSSNWWVLFISPWESEKWSKVCKLSLLHPLFSNNYLSVFTVLPIQLPYSNPMAVPRSVLGNLIGPMQEMLRNLLLCDIIASIRAYWHIVTLFWAEPHCSFFETIHSVQNALWELQLLRGGRRC